MADQDYQTYKEVNVPYTVPVNPVPVKKKSNWWIIVLIILLLLCCCVVIVGGVIWYLVASGQYRFDWSLVAPFLSLI